jgi:hypothetical protein
MVQFVDCTLSEPDQPQHAKLRVAGVVFLGDHERDITAAMAQLFNTAIATAHLTQ